MPIPGVRARAVAGVLLTGASLLVTALVTTPAASAAPDATYLDVGFGGNFNVGNIYTSAGSEKMGGVLQRRTGRESLGTEGLSLAGGRDGMSFKPTDLSLGTTTVDQGFVLEAKFTPGAAQGDMATIMAVAGGLYVRYQDGELRFSYDFQHPDGTWSNHLTQAPIPSAGTQHTLSVAYLPTSEGDQRGSVLVAYVDGVQLTTMTEPAARITMNTTADLVGIGNDVHPAALDRGFTGTVRAARFATASGAFNPAMFAYQQVGFVQTPLKSAFVGTLHGTDYVGGPGDTVTGDVTVTGGALTVPGRLDLTGSSSGISWATSNLGDLGIEQVLLTELVIDQALLQPGTVLTDLAGAIRLVATGDRNVTITVGAVTAERSLPEPAERQGLSFYHVALHSSIDTGLARTVSLLVQGKPVGDPVTAIAPATGSAMGFATGAKGAVYGLAVTVGAAGDGSVLGALPCAATPVDPANQIAVTPADCMLSVIAKASALRPTDRQMTWQEANKTAFLHFGINTYNNLEWSHGDTPAADFQPTGLDTDQWMKHLRDNGFRYAILTVKHHDGFVLYQSRYTDYGVMGATEWQNGKGDVLGEFVASARRYGMKVGIYLSPADWNQVHKGVYGNGSTGQHVTIPTLTADDNRAGKDLPTYTYTATDYGKYFLNQLYETLTEYGPIDEVWFDGADGGIGPAHAEKFDFPAYYDLIRKLQPQATIAVSGPDVRWVGNEGGRARENEWSPVATYLDERGAMQTTPRAEDADLASDQVLIEQVSSGRASQLSWWPAEVDVSIHTGWFWHDDQQPKSVAALQDIFYQSVGRNSVLLLNIPPNKAGQLDSRDTTRLAEWTAAMRQEFPADLLLGRTVADVGGMVHPELTDGDVRTAANLGTKTPELTARLTEPITFDRIEINEDIRGGGQQVRSWAVDIAGPDKTWTEIARSGTIGYRKIVKLDAPVTADTVRLRVMDSRGTVRLAGMSLYRSATEAVTAPTTYYVDCAAQAAGPGTQEHPMASLGQLWDINLPPGATVLVKAGTQCAGPLELWGYGTPEAPARLDTYGSGGDPIIATEQVQAAVAALKEQGWQGGLLDRLAQVAPPPVTLSVSPAQPLSAWYTGPVVVSAAVDGAPAGIEIDLGEGFTTYSAPVTLSADGTHNVRARSLSPSGVTGPPRSVRVSIDQQPPWVGATLDHSTRMVSVSATDETSGIDRIQYRLGDGQWDTYREPVPVDQAAVTVQVQAFDVAGNVSKMVTVQVPARHEPFWSSAITPPPTPVAESGSLSKTGPGHLIAKLALAGCALLAGVGLLMLSRRARNQANRPASPGVAS